VIRAILIAVSSLPLPRGRLLQPHSGLHLW